MSLFPSLIEAVRRNRVRTNTGPLNFTREKCERLSSLQHYDFGTMFRKGYPDDIGEALFEETLREVAADLAAGLRTDDEDEVSIEMVWDVKGIGDVPHIIPNPEKAAIEAIESGLTVVAFAFYNGGWHLETLDCEKTCLVAKRLIRDAELNVEFVERADVETERVNRGRAKGGLSPIKTTRVISLSHIRKQYLGGSSQPHQGGTHRSPCGHYRYLTERVISPKGRKSYVQNARRVTVKGGPVGTITKVTP